MKVQANKSSVNILLVSIVIFIWIYSIQGSMSTASTAALKSPSTLFFAQQSHDYKETSSTVHISMLMTSLRDRKHELYATLHSIFLTRSSTCQVSFHFLTDVETKPTIHHYFESVKNSRYSVEYLTLDDLMHATKEFHNISNFHPGSLLKASIELGLPHVSRVISLDFDMLVTLDICKLYTLAFADLDANDKMIQLGVETTHGFTSGGLAQTFIAYDVPLENKFNVAHWNSLNGGFQTLDLDRMRREKWTRTYKAMINSYSGEEFNEVLRYPDQNIFSLYAKTHKEIGSVRANFNVQLLQLVHGDSSEMWNLIQEHVGDIWIYHGSAGVFRSDLRIARTLWWAFYPFRSEIKEYGNNIRMISDADIETVLKNRASLVIYVKGMPLH